MIGTLRRLHALAGASPAGLALAALLGSLAVLFGVGLLASAGYLVSRAAERPAILSLSVVIVAVRFFGLARPLARYLERLASHDVALRGLARVRVRFFERIEPLAPGELAAFRHGDLVARMAGDVDSLQNLYLRGLLPPVVAVCAGAVAVGAAAAILPAAAVILAAGLLLGGIAVPMVTARIAARASRERAAAQGHLSAELVELLRGAPELAVYGRETDAITRVRAADRALVTLGRRDALAGGVGEALGVLVSGLTLVAVLAVTVSAHDADRIDRVLVAVVALLALASFESVAPLGRAAKELTATVASGGRVLELVDRDPKIRDPSEPAPAPPARLALALEGVVARYSPDEPAVLDDVTLRLEPGRKIALVGPSGAGKSTVVNLLLRFLDPERGRVTLDGRDLRDYRQEDIRRAIAVAGQNAYLFSTTIRENVRLGRAEATDEAVEDALRRARVWEWVESLPDGLDTVVGEEGRELSGGQRQRVALARALLADSPVLVLDEPTAHLDVETAERLVGDIFAAAGGRSVLLVTHRSEGLALVDEVVALPPGGSG